MPDVDEKAPILGWEVSGRGPRLVLVHGFTQTRRSWRALVDPLQERNEVFSVDLPGHGTSGEVSVPDLSATAAALGRTAGRASYVGYSLGGRVCLCLALEHPELVESLVLVSATAGIADEEEAATRRRADEALALRLDRISKSGEGLSGFLDEWLAGPLFRHLDAEQQDLAARLSNDPSGLAASLRSAGAGRQVPSYERLHELSMPVLIVAGEKDEKFAALAEEIGRRIGKNATVAIVPRVGHAVPFEDKAGFVELVLSFLEALGNG